MLLQDFLLKQKGHYSRFAQLEKEDCAKGPTMKKPPNTLLQEGGREEGTGSTPASLTFLIFCFSQGRKWGFYAELEKSKLTGLTSK